MFDMDGEQHGLGYPAAIPSLMKQRAIHPAPAVSGNLRIDASRDVLSGIGGWVNAAGVRLGRGSR